MAEKGHRICLDIDAFHEPHYLEDGDELETLVNNNWVKTEVFSIQKSGRYDGLAGLYEPGMIPPGLLVRVAGDAIPREDVSHTLKRPPEFNGEELITANSITKTLDEWAKETGIHSFWLHRLIHIYLDTPEEAIKATPQT
jgi:hypothetical protein